MNIIHLAPILSISNEINTEKKSINFAAEGLSNSVPNLAYSQKKAGNKVGIVSCFPSENASSNEIYWGALDKNLFYFFQYRKMYKDLIKNFGNIDLLNVHDIYNLKQIFFSLYFLFNGVKVFVTPRGTFSEEALKRSKLKKTFFLFIYKIYAKFIYAFVALNEREKKQIAKVFPEKKIIIIGNGVEYSEERNGLLVKHFDYKNKTKILNIGFLGRFDIHIKGLDLLLNAYLNYQKRSNKIEIKLFLIGKHKKAREWDSKVFIKKIKDKLPCPEMLEIRGPFYGFSKWEELAKLDVLIQPSRTEGMPNTVLEAMATGIPCVVTDNTNVGDLILNASAGWKIDTSEGAILDFLLNLNSFKKRDLIDLGNNAKKHVQRELTWDSIGKINYF
ncbi:MAG: glycosyltransferase [Rickettsiales bacterium TMED289]|nr:MAG: glycosyltransferase [Rickettsiales bacterium TMED289]